MAELAELPERLRVNTYSLRGSRWNNPMPCRCPMFNHLPRPQHFVGHSLYAGHVQFPDERGGVSRKLSLAVLARCIRDDLPCPSGVVH